MSLLGLISYLDQWSHFVALGLRSVYRGI